MVENDIENKNIDIIFLQKNYLFLKIINGINFTPREIDIISCLVSGRASKKMASLLSIAPRTSGNHIHNVMLKIGCSSKENIIDFIEKSEKLALLKKHYSGLLIKSTFEEQLRKISSLLKEKPPICTIVCNKDHKHILSLVLQLREYLNLVGIKVILDFIEENNVVYLSEKAEKRDCDYVFYNLSSLLIEQVNATDKESNIDIPYFIKLVNKNKDFINFIILEERILKIPKKFINCSYISLSEQGNYYFFVIEILKKMLFNVSNINQNSLEFKKSYMTICDHVFLGKTVEDTQTSFYKLGNINLVNWFIIRKWHLTIIILLTLSISLFIYSFMENKQSKEDSHFILPETKLSHLITSYLPEILTGNELFIGRDKELQQIKHFLNKDNIVIITGRGGVGKSSCAIEYGKRNKKSKIVRYFNAETVNKIEQQYKELAKELNVDTDKQQRNVVMQLVNNKLNTILVGKLFIFDNVNNYDDIKEYLINLPSKIQVIITTRQPTLILAKPHIKIEEFSNKEAALYLKNSLPNREINEEFIYKLIESTGNLPYDIKCVAAYLQENYSTDNSTVLIKKIGSNIKDKLFQEFTISSDQIKQHAWKILQYAANLDPDFISIEIIQALFPQKIEMSSLALRKLELLSIISIIDNQNHQVGFKVHRNIQNNVQNITKNHHECAIHTQQLISHLLTVLDRLFPEITFNPTSQWQVTINLQPHIEKLLNTKPTFKIINKKDKINLANLYCKLARYYSAITMDYKQALKYAKLALECRIALYGNNSKNLDLAKSFHIVGVIYRKLGNAQESLKCLERGLQIRRQSYSGIHQDIADSLHTVGSAYNQQGETTKGLKYGQMALEMNQKLYFGNHYDTGCSLNLVGISYLDLGDFQKSLEYFKAGLKMFYKLNPTPYEKIAALQSNIAYNYNKLGKHEEALRYAKASVGIFKKRYPNGHPRAIYSLDDLGDSLIRINKIEQGLKVLHEALSLVDKFSMEKHYITAFVLQDLGWGYFKKKDYHSALKYAKKGLLLRKELYGSQNYHELAESLYNLGNIHAALHNQKEALSLYQEAMNMYNSLSLGHLPEAKEIKEKIDNLF